MISPVKKKKKKEGYVCVKNALFQSREWYVRLNVYLWNGLLYLISVPPGCGSTFSSYPRRLNKVPFTPEDFHKILVYPLRIWVLPRRTRRGLGGWETGIKCNSPIAVADEFHQSGEVCAIQWTMTTSLIGEMGLGEPGSFFLTKFKVSAQNQRSVFNDCNQSEI